jgi:hypothetical protein
MANAYSTPINYGQTIPTTDLAQYLGTIQHGMQQKFDVNLAKIDELISKVSAVPLARDKDKRYLGEKLQNLLSIVDANSKIDLTDNVVARQISGQIASAIDDNVRTQLQNSSKISSFDQQLTAMKAKKPELYSSDNHAFALEKAGYNAYMNEESDTLGSLSYTPYIDVNKVALDKIKQLKEIRGKQEIELPDPQNPGGTIKRSIDGLTKEEIFQYIPGLLGAAEQAQLQINGWAKYRGNLAGAKQEFENYMSTQNSSIDEQIKHEETIANNVSGNSEKERKQAQLKIESYKRQKEALAENSKSIDLTKAESVGFFLERNGWRDTIANAAQAKESVIYGKDERYFEIEKLSIDRERLNLEKAKAAKELGVDANGNPVIDQNAISVSAREKDITKDLDPIATLKKDYDGVYNEMVNSVKQAYQSEKMPDDIKAQFKSELKKYGYDENGRVINEALAAKSSRAYAMKVAFDRSGMGTYNPQTAKKLSGLEAKRSGIASDFAIPKRDAVKETFTKNADAYVDALKRTLTSSATPASYSSSVPGISVSTGSTGETPESYKAANKFVTSLGGWKNIKQALLKDPSKIQEFAKISGQVIGKLPSSKNLEVDAYKVANQKLVERTEQGKAAYFNTAKIVNITDEKLREKVINMIPQTEDTQLFDSKKPISFYKNDDGSLTIVQNAGYSDGKDGPRVKIGGKVIVNKEDAAYKEVMKYVELDESKRGLDASKTKVKITPAVSPNYSDSNNKLTLSRKDAAIISLSPEVIKGFATNPVNYLTEPRTKEVFKAGLQNIVSPEEAEKFVSKLADNFNFFKLEMKPIDGEWAISLKTKNGKLINEGGTGIQYLQEDMAYLVNHYPQVIISDALLKYIKENPSEINTILP